MLWWDRLRLSEFKILPQQLVSYCHYCGSDHNTLLGSLNARATVREDIAKRCVRRLWM